MDRATANVFGLEIGLSAGSTVYRLWDSDENLVAALWFEQRPRGLFIKALSAWVPFPVREQVVRLLFYLACKDSYAQGLQKVYSESPEPVLSRLLCDMGMRRIQINPPELRPPPFDYEDPCVLPEYHTAFNGEMFGWMQNVLWHIQPETLAQWEEIQNSFEESMLASTFEEKWFQLPEPKGR